MQQENSQDRLWSKDFLIVFGVNFLLFLCFYLLVVIMPTYAAEEFHASTGMAGFASSIFVVGALIGRLIGGSIIERVGRRPLLLTGLVSFSVLIGLYFIINSLAVLLIVRFLHGLAFALASTATGTIAASLIPNSRRGEGTGYYGVSIIIASAIGPFIGLMILEHASMTGNFVLCAILGVLSLVSSLFMRIPKLVLTAEQAREMKGFRLSNFIELKALPISIISFVMGFGYSSILSYLKIFAGEIGLVEAATYFFIVYAIVVILSRPFTGRWFDHRGANVVMYPAIVSFAIGILLLGLAHHGITLLLSAVFVGLGYGTTQSSSQALAIKRSPAHRIGLATSTFYIFVDVGIGFGPLLLGFLTPLAGFRGMYMTIAVLLALSVILYYFLVGKRESREKAARTAA
ncbi:MFS family permease [Paenibacillus lactis]|uniref:MFS family permease n=1 Tax=Paenibacillus lactis TaxID=228574 RepID=A0ABS4F4Y7_9BACL|nr:MFS transporter [Paenibacillus lactis]MBP1891304.1 MFS family permease [Paenibacillus lactis]